MNYMIATPEIFVLCMACIILLADVFLGSDQENDHQIAYYFSLFTLVGAFFLGCHSQSSVINIERALAFNGLFVSDSLSFLLKGFIYTISFVVLIYSRKYLQDRNLFKGEYFVLLLFAVLGMMIMASAANFLPMYLGLELFSLSLYAMVAMYRDSRGATEAAMKYFVLGAIASGMLLYGMSMIYGATGSLDLAEISQAITNFQSDKMILTFGLVFIVAGVAFKLGVAPFHMWAPDVYEGAPTAVTLFIGSVPKLAGFVLTYRLLVDALSGLAMDWQQMLMILAVLSIGLGNVIALSQTNTKRLLAYSTIAHMGYMLLGFIAGAASGYAASLFYIIAYTIMTTAAFGVIIFNSRIGHEAEQLDDLKGLGKRSPWFAFVMLVIMFSMAGIPPFIGFWAKWFVLKEVVASGHIWLAAVAVFFTIIGAYYYLRIIRLIYFDSSDEEIEISAPVDLKLVLSLNGIIILLLGILPGTLLTLCLAVFSA